MNAKLLEHFVSYREKHGLDVCKSILSQKIKYQFSVINKTAVGVSYVEELLQSTSVQNAMLVEARAAKIYWKYFSRVIESKIEWKGRKPRNGDTANKLLDIGYHYLSTHVSKICDMTDMQSALGIFHKAQSKSATPFVYDYMEWLRPTVVDYTFLKMICRKKKIMYEVHSRDIKYFIHSIQKRFNTYYYHSQLGYCITLDYWVNINLLSFINSIHGHTKWKPKFPSLRHESRCKTKPPRTEFEAV